MATAMLSLSACRHARVSDPPVKKSKLHLRQEAEMLMVGHASSGTRPPEAEISLALQTAQREGFSPAGAPMLVFPEGGPMITVFPVSAAPSALPRDGAPGDSSETAGWRVTMRPPEQVVYRRVKGDPIQVFQEGGARFMAMAAEEGHPCMGPLMIVLLSDPRSTPQGEQKLEFKCMISEGE